MTRTTDRSHSFTIPGARVTLWEDTILFEGTEGRSLTLTPVALLMVVQTYQEQFGPFQIPIAFPFIGIKSVND